LTSARVYLSSRRSFPPPRRQSLSIPPAWQYVLDFSRTPLVIETSSGQLSSDAGLPHVCQFDQRIGLTRAFSDTFDDPLGPDLTKYTFLAVIRLEQT
jgi:hypothetical protein